jgi:hypothetical protein
MLHNKYGLRAADELQNNEVPSEDSEIFSEI